MMESTEVVEWLAPRVDDSGDCWLWRCPLDRDGYAQRQSIQGEVWVVHRWVWTHLVGPIPDALVVDHLCRVRHCMNPDHMEIVTRAENVMRGYGPPARSARQTHCRLGHPLSGDNVYLGPRGNRNPDRQCVTCRRMR